MLEDAIAAGASMRDNVAEVMLVLQGCSLEHIDRQLQVVRNLENYLGSGE